MFDGKLILTCLLQVSINFTNTHSTGCARTGSTSDPVNVQLDLFSGQLDRMIPVSSTAKARWSYNSDSVSPLRLVITHLLLQGYLRQAETPYCYAWVSLQEVGWEIKWCPQGKAILSTLTSQQAQDSLCPAVVEWKQWSICGRHFLSSIFSSGWVID